MWVGGAVMNFGDRCAVFFYYKRLMPDEPHKYHCDYFPKRNETQ